MTELELKLQVERAAIKIFRSALTREGKRLQETMKHRLFSAFQVLSQIQTLEQYTFESSKYERPIVVREGDIRLSWEKLLARFNSLSPVTISQDTLERYVAEFEHRGLLTLEHEDLMPASAGATRLPALSLLRRLKKYQKTLKVIRLDVIRTTDEEEAQDAVTRLLSTVNQQISENSENSENSEHSENSENFCGVVIADTLIASNAMMHHEDNTTPQKLLLKEKQNFHAVENPGEPPAITTAPDSSGWTVEVTNSVKTARQKVSAERIPERVDGEFYATWVQEKAGAYYAPWIVWDVDANLNRGEDASTAFARTRLFVQTLSQAGVPKRAMRVVFSTRRGFHVYLDARTIDLRPSTELHERLKFFCTAVLPSADASVYAPRHILGIPNSRHRTTGQYYTLLEADELFSKTLREIAAMASEPRSMTLTRAESVPVVESLRRIYDESTPRRSSALPSSDEMRRQERGGRPEFREGASEGSRMTSMTQLVWHYAFTKRLSEDETLVLARAANARFKPPMEDAEVVRNVKAAYRKIDYRLGRDEKFKQG